MNEIDEHAKAIHKASEDLRDIGDLKRSEPFNRYWLRRLKAKRDAYQDRFQNAPPAEVDKDEREILRRLVAAFDEIPKMLDQDAATAQRLLDRV